MHIVKLMNDYSVRFPLWDEKGLLEPEQLPLSSALRDQLVSWALDFQKHYHWQDGWGGTDVASEHLGQGQRLFEQLREELGDDYEIAFEPWEHRGRAPS